ncbi:hypothetical protein OG792_34210 [Micromonospora sp. NBC_01699]|uniref:hypothetical protein n=1 Tax=Micromonospora sp. NBC_01699 TaxID=2975984 RepID=UPI002E2CB411|nr:hypothetical protein [Micromonospora sp. NBC_01699]
MDLFFRTFLPAAAEAGLAAPIMSRHLPIFRRCVAADDAAVLVARCIRPDAPVPGGHLLLLTSHRLVVTRQSRVLRRLGLHLNTDLRHLSNVSWTPDPRLPVLEFTATAMDGIRERYLIRAGHCQPVPQLDALLDHVFRGAGAPGPQAPPSPKEARRLTFSPAVAA